MVDRLAQSVNVHIVHAALSLERFAGPTAPMQSLYCPFGTAYMIAAWVAIELLGRGVMTSRL